MVSGPIILLEDDPDDIEIFQEILKELDIPNEFVVFARPVEAFEFLEATVEQPLIIISDVNMPGMSGREFKNRLDSNERLKKKSIPFIFYSTSANRAFVTDAYLNLSVQGFFLKGNSYKEIKDQLRIIFDYWKVCQHPNSYLVA